MRRLVDNTWLRGVLALAAGALQTLTFAPFYLWPLGLLSCALVFWLAQNRSPGNALLTGWLVGLGLFGSGASWVYVSIHTYGGTPAPLAGLLTLTFCAFLALFTAAQFWLCQRLAPTNTRPVHALLVFSSLWVLMDWVRSWLLTGFPWLYLGYGHVSSPLAWLAPVGGVHLVTLVTVLSGAALAALWQTRGQDKPLLGMALTLSLVWAAGMLAPPHFEPDDTSAPVRVTLVQGNIDQNIKWASGHRMHSIDVYSRLSSPFWATSEIIVWPETAIPFFQDDAAPLLARLNARGVNEHTSLVTGIPWRGDPMPGRTLPTLHNSIISLGNGQGVYHKQKLVPFGEYVPLEHVLRGLIRFLDLPMSAFVPGPPEQSHLMANGHRIAPYICYEIAYSDLVAKTARQSQLLVTISNDGWFGHSIGPWQHLQIARMRALETARFTLRATNNGITAIISPTGDIIAQAPQFEEATLQGVVFPAQEATPFMQAGSTPTLTFCVLCLSLFRRRASSA